jgi:hypothetical protein
MSRRLYHLSDFLGEEIRQEGNQTRHFCLMCGTKGLLLNHQKRVWFCHTCSIGGGIMDEEGDTTTTFVVESRDKRDRILKYWWNALNTRFEPKLNDPPNVSMRGISSDILRQIGDTFWWKNEPALKIELSLGDVCTGHQMYVPSHIIKYVSFGQKGIHTVSTFERTICSPTPVLIFEGMFDYIHVYQELLSINPDVAWLDAHLVYVAGNQISNEQLLEIKRQFNPEYHTFWICFDNDKINPPLKAKQKLELICPNRNQVHLLLPPFQNSKDWDEVLTRNREKIYELVREVK